MRFLTENLFSFSAAENMSIHPKSLRDSNISVDLAFLFRSISGGNKINWVFEFCWINTWAKMENVEYFRSGNDPSSLRQYLDFF